MSLDSLSTRGFYEAGSGSSGGGVVTIAAVSPTPNTTPGAGGGMPADYISAKSTPIVIDVTDSAGASNIAYVQITAVFLDGSMEPIARNGSFVTAYQKNSLIAGLSLGTRYTIARTVGWPGQIQGGGNLAVGIIVDVVDTGGNLTTMSFFYEMPQQETVVVPAPAVAPVPTAIDMAAEARSYLIWQFRSS